MEQMLLRAVLVAVAVTVTVLFGRWWRRRSGAVRSASAGETIAPADLAAVGLELSDADAGALLLGSPSCAPCDVVKRLLDELGHERERFRWVYADVGDQLALARRLGVMRVPTLLVVAPSGRILARSSGVPRPADVRRALDGGRRDDDAFDDVAV